MPLDVSRETTDETKTQAQGGKTVKKVKEDCGEVNSPL